MENWGLIIGRADAYCIDPEKGSLKDKQRVMGIQSHEVAHMWYATLLSAFRILLSLSFRFGNITTMEWWTYLYLNEGEVS
jgi:aminopeptidase 2